MAQPSPNDSGHLKTQAHELVKQKTFYDAQSRPEYIYTAPANAQNGTPCSVVRVSYDGLSARVDFMKESTSTWDSSWETF